MESQIEKAFDIPREECIRVSWSICKLIFSFTCLWHLSKCTGSFFFYRFQQNMAPMLKRFYKQLWIEFHSKWVYCLSSREPCLPHNSESVLRFFSTLFSQARGKHWWPVQSPRVWLQFRPLQRSGGQHSCVWGSGQKRGQDHVGASAQNLRGQRAGAPPARWTPNTNAVCDILRPLLIVVTLIIIMIKCQLLY